MQWFAPACSISMLLCAISIFLKKNSAYNVHVYSQVEMVSQLLHYHFPRSVVDEFVFLEEITLIERHQTMNADLPRL